MTGQITHVSINGGGVIELDGSWYGIKEVRFSEAAVTGSLKAQDKVQVVIKGGRKAPVVNLITKVKA